MQVCVNSSQVALKLEFSLTLPHHAQLCKGASDIAVRDTHLDVLAHALVRLFGSQLRVAHALLAAHAISDPHSESELALLTEMMMGMWSVEVSLMSKFSHAANLLEAQILWGLSRYWL
jgi:hypothetical protein